MKPRFKKTYVLAPYGNTTGGIELSHQLVGRINDMGGEAYIVYIDNNRIVKDASVTPQYSKYNIKVSDTIEDSEENILILPEVYYDMIYRYKDIRIGCWWMSVDNHYLACHWTDSWRFYKSLGRKVRYVYRSLRMKARNRIKDMLAQNERLYQFYQSVYAHHHL